MAKISDTPWSQFTAASYTGQQYAKSALIDTGVGAVTSKNRYKLPILEPDGTLNRNAVYAAASALAGGQGGVQDTAAHIKAAAVRLLAIYQSQLKQPAPDSLLQLAGASSAQRLTNQALAKAAAK